MLFQSLCSEEARLPGTRNPMTYLDTRRQICALFFMCLFVTIVAPAQTVTTLATFDGTNGAQPNGLVQSKTAELWGSTSGTGQTACGTVFELTLLGAFTTPL